MMLLLPFLQNATPDTVSYMLLGYGLMGAVAVFYVGSIIVRRRNYMRDIIVLEDLED
jgi:predicted MFS family arabinose efflux permease